MKETKKVKRTFKQLKEFNGAAQAYLQKVPEAENTKFGYALKRFADMNLQKIWKEYNQKRELLAVEHALEDKETKAIIPSEPGSQRPYKYDKKGLTALMNAENELFDEWEEKEFEVEPYIATSLPKEKDLTEEQREAFKGLVM